MSTCHSFNCPVLYLISQLSPEIFFAIRLNKNLTHIQEEKKRKTDYINYARLEYWTHK